MFLHGALSPLNGIGRKDIQIDELLKRLLEKGTTREIILATNPGFEGDYTAGFIKDVIKEELTSPRQSTCHFAGAWSASR